MCNKATATYPEVYSLADDTCSKENYGISREKRIWPITKVKDDQ